MRDDSKLRDRCHRRRDAGVYPEARRVERSGVIEANAGIGQPQWHVGWLSVADGANGPDGEDCRRSCEIA